MVQQMKLQQQLLEKQHQEQLRRIEQLMETKASGADAAAAAATAGGGTPRSRLCEARQMVAAALAEALEAARAKMKTKDEETARMKKEMEQMAAELSRLR